ncbi:glycoside hydrolase family 15 protein [Myceligenerans salitolerans]|uniref:Glycoside hydrolase family 15 protein n=1 Tax=Myceligenerans salitolerans TaxID=1230528 RepID=A0ABS3I6G5_9MICO|nr:glycoside hydrolase family 15 protein [Myceligenerans salitolerans]MBO0608595.1 glycoside hydrolase family 15 protein [Myceligenerans salitolerans]
MPVPAAIEDYGFIGDLQTGALIGRDGSVDWLCLPRFDSPACFAALLGDENAGRWRIAPVDAATASSRRYRGETLVLETTWETPDGTVQVVDAMPPRGDAADLVRVVRGVSGRVRMRSDLRLRFDYGHVDPWLTAHERSVTGVAGPDAVQLSADVPLRIRDGDVSAEVEVSAGESCAFVLTYHPSHLPAPRPADPDRALHDTEDFWARWVEQADYDGRWRDAVVRSLIVLKALTYAPTGGIAAAATTSLPENLGGVRNWDYRYCWLRDAAFTLQALVSTGFVDEARAWRDWLLRAVAGDPADLQIMYGLDGTRRLGEYELPWLAGYENSRPVRVGNAAAGQYQLDVWGEVLDCLHVARESGIAPMTEAWELQRALLDFLEGAWDQPDNGLWEVRGPRRHFVHSKVMAWAGVDRAVRAVEEHGLEGPVERWRALRDRIRADVLARGFDERRGTFTQFYGSEGLDAALLLIPRVGFLPWHDPRVVGTVEAVQRELSEDGFLLRYRPEADGRVDGLPGDEGVFLACTAWLADALHGIGRHEEAVEVFERLLDLRNDLGLLSEQYHTGLRRQLGNTPQAFSHFALVNAARRLSGAPTTTAETPRGGTSGPGEEQHP